MKEELGQVEGNLVRAIYRISAFILPIKSTSVLASSCFPPLLGRPNASQKDKAKGRFVFPEKGRRRATHSCLHRGSYHISNIDGPVDLRRAQTALVRNWISLTDLLNIGESKDRYLHRKMNLYDVNAHRDWQPCTEEPRYRPARP